MLHGSSYRESALTTQEKLTALSRLILRAPLRSAQAITRASIADQDR